MKILPLVFAVAFVSGPVVAGEKVVKTRLMPIGVASSVKGLYFMNNGRTEELTAGMTGLGAGIEYTGPALLAVYSDENGPLMGASGLEAQKPLTVVRLPEADDRVLLIVAPPKKDGLAPVIRAYGLSTNDLHAGDYRLFNFSKDTVVGVLGEKRMSIKAGGIVTTRDKSWENMTLDLPVKFGIADLKRGSRLLYFTVWGHQPAQRNIILIFPGPSNARPLDVRRFNDVPTANPDPRAAPKR
ncbi:MAG: hypothetical protein ACO3JG_00265 [Luteolibacter sp.]